MIGKRLVKLALAGQFVLLGALGADVEGQLTSSTDGGASAVQFKVIDHILFSNEAEPLDPTAANQTHLRHEDYVQSQYRDYEFSTQFTNKLSPGSPGTSRPFVLEKLTAGKVTENWKVYLGDTHQELGRGLALSLRRDDAFGINTTLQGVSAAYNPEGFEAGVFGGRINTLANPVAINALEDPLAGNQIYLAGLTTGYALSDTARVGAHYFTAVQEPETPAARTFDKIWHTVGVTYKKDSLLENVDLYVEGNALVQKRLSGGSYQDLPTGTASFASLTWSPSPFQVIYEVKDYRDYRFNFRRAPSLEANIVETSHEDNVFGNRLTIAHKNLRARTQYSGSYLLGRDRFLNRDIHHGILSAKIPGFSGGSFEVSVGYRTVPGDSNMGHASILSKLKTWRYQTFELAASKQYSNINLDVLPAQVDRNKLDATYTFSKAFNLTVGYEYVPTNEVEAGQHFANLSAVLSMGALIARGFVGKTSGGTLCSGGICRTIPPFEGARFETLYTF